MGDDSNFVVFKILLTTSSNVLPLNLKQTFPPIMWIFNEGEGDGIESRLPFNMFITCVLNAEKKDPLQKIGNSLKTKSKKI